MEEEADAFPLEEEEVVEVAVLQVLRTYRLEGEVVEEASLVQPLVEEEVEEEALKLPPQFEVQPIDYCSAEPSEVVGSFAAIHYLLDNH